MSYEFSSSPVAPASGSRLWTAGASGGLAALILIALAILHPELAPSLIAGAMLVAGSTWLINRSREPSRGVEPLAPETPSGELASAELLDGALEALEDAVLIVGGEEPDDIAGRRIVMANQAARDLLRVQRRGGLLVQVMRDPGVLEAVDEALFGGVSRVTDYTTGGARDRRWRAWSRPLAPARPGEALALLVLRDETDARRTEMMRVDFLANASHELRTPLASLSGFIETLKGHARDDTRARDRFLDIMAAQAERMTRLVADLLSLSRIELNEHIPPSGRVALDAAASDVIDAVSVLVKDRQVEVRLNAQGRTHVVGERDEIVQVVQNLLDNGVKYSPSGGVVDVTIRRDLTFDQALAGQMAGATRLSLLTPDRDVGTRYAAVTVRDYGPGMAREHLPRLTERFYRVEGQKSGERLGTGLGLAIVKHIINRHQGGLTVESTLGAGSAFTAWFPMPKHEA